MPAATAASGQNSSSRIANEISALVRETYRDGVQVVTRIGTITISRGKRAAQVQVLDENRFLVSLRRNQTFHMCAEPVDHVTMAALVKRMVEAPEAIRS